MVFHGPETSLVISLSLYSSINAESIPLWLDHLDLRFSVQPYLHC